MKVKLYKGPFNGKTYVTDGRNDIIIRGPKPMTRQQKWEVVQSQQSFMHPVRYPTVEARYRLCIMRIPTGSNEFVTAPATHPDGSVFFEYVAGSRRELTG